jgi:hypothetical protein
MRIVEWLGGADLVGRARLELCKAEIAATTTPPFVAEQWRCMMRLPQNCANQTGKQRYMYCMKIWVSSLSITWKLRIGVEAFVLSALLTYLMLTEAWISYSDLRRSASSACDIVSPFPIILKSWQIVLHALSYYFFRKNACRKLFYALVRM